MMKRLVAKGLSLLLAGTIAVGAVGTLFITDTVLHAEAMDATTTLNLISSDLKALTPFCPTLNIVGSFVSNIASLTRGDSGAAALKQINDNINELRKEMQEQYKVLNSRIDENTKIIVDAIGNKLVINDAGIRLTELAQTVGDISDQINTDVNSTKKTNEQKNIAIAKQIMNYQKWNDKSNFIHMVSIVGDLLAGNSFAELGSKDFYTAVYQDCQQNVMFSGEAYDLADPYIDRVMDEYYHAYTVAMQCLQAVRDVANFTGEQVAGLSAQDYKDYLDVAADADQAEAKMEKLTKQLFDLDDPKSVGTHYLAFKYRKLHERNVFVDQGHANITISPDIASLEIKADVGPYTDVYYYDSYTNHLSIVKGEIEKAIKAAIDKSAIGSAKINELYEYVKRAYPDKSFDDYLDHVGISGKALKSIGKAYFPISDAVSEGSELKHRPKDEPELKGNSKAITDTIGRSDYIKYNNCGVKTFDHTKAQSGTEKHWFYKIENWYVGYFFDTNYSYDPKKQEGNMLVFQKADPLKVPESGSDIVEILRKEGVYDYTIDWRAANTWRYPVGFNVFSNSHMVVRDYFGNEVDKTKAKCIPESTQSENDGIDLSGSSSTRIIINTTKPGDYQIRWTATNAFGDKSYSKWITYAAYDPDGRITADASGWSKRVTLGVYDLYQLVKVSILNTSGLPVNDPYSWEAREACIKIDGSKMTVHDFGKFHIRAKTVNADGKTIYSDWVTFESVSDSSSREFKINPYLMYEVNQLKNETFTNVSTDLNSMLRFTVAYEAGAMVFETTVKPVWELKELPEKGCYISGDNNFFARQPGVYHVRAVSYKYNIVTGWYTIKAMTNGADDSEFEYLGFEYNNSYDEPDENTSFVIRQSYTGLVGAEPDRIEEPSTAEPLSATEANSEHLYHKRLMVDAVDGISGREIRVKYTWEAQEADGISLAEDGLVTFSKAGTYHVRVNSGEYSSEWFEISAVTESEEYATIAFCDDDESLIERITLPWGTKFDPPADPVRAGYTFAGWSQAIPERMPADDTAIYAVWVKNEPVENNGGDNSATGAAVGDNPATGAAVGLGIAALAAAAVAVMKKKSTK